MDAGLIIKPPYLWPDERPWLEYAHQTLAGNFANSGDSTRESLEIGLRNIQHPICRRAFEHLNRTRQENNVSKPKRKRDMKESHLIHGAEQTALWGEPETVAPKPKANHQLCNQTSGESEWWTPGGILEAARRTLGVIDLDPASCATANERVKAVRFFCRADDGLRQEWRGRLFMNHPFGRQTNSLWINKLVFEYRSGRVSEACCISFASTSETWFKPLLAFPQCFLVPRTNYLLPDGSEKPGVTKGSVVTYIGPNVKRFAESFSGLGVVKLAYPSSERPHGLP